MDEQAWRQKPYKVVSSTPSQSELEIRKLELQAKVEKERFQLEREKLQLEAEEKNITALT